LSIALFHFNRLGFNFAQLAVGIFIQENYSGKRVVVDAKLIASRGEGRAMGFAFSLT